MRVLRLLRQPVPLALWLGQLFSVTGDKLYAMAVLWLVLQLTGSAKLMAVVSVAESAPYVVVGFLGAGLIARSTRLRAMIRLDLLSAVVVALVPVSYLLGLRSVLLLVAVAAAASALEALFDPALQSVLPDLVAGTDLQPTVALTDSTDRLARVLGPGSAGLLLLLVPEIQLFSLDAATFLASAAALAFVARRTASAPPSQKTPAEPRGNLLDGLREVLRQRSLRVGLAVRGACNLAWPAFTIGLPFELVHRLHCGLGAYGLLLGVFGVGNLAGNLLSGSHRAGRHLLVIYCVSWSLVGAGFLALAMAPSLALAALATAWTGIFTPLANVSMDAHIATVVPVDRLPRVYALQRVVVVGASALGVCAVAAGIDAISAAGVIAAAGAWMLLVGVLAAVRTGLESGVRTGMATGDSGLSPGALPPAAVRMYRRSAPPAAMRLPGALVRAVLGTGRGRSLRSWCSMPGRGRSGRRASRTAPRRHRRPPWGGSTGTPERGSGLVSGLRGRRARLLRHSRLTRPEVSGAVSGLVGYP